MENLLEKIGIVSLVVFFVFVMYFALVVVPFALYTEAQCLRQGYPKMEVTIGLEGYCINLDGAVTAVVIPQK